jgi:histidine ammonia-lyase
VLAIEILSAARALDLRVPAHPGPATAAVRDALRQRVDGPATDRWLAPEIEAAVAMTFDGALVAAAESVTGQLN